MDDKSKSEGKQNVIMAAYNDALHPAMTSIGNILALPFQAIDVALSKPRLWVAEKQYSYERTRQLLAEKLKDVPPEDIVPPENYIAVPALQQISYCFDSDELRNLYANLLAASMQSSKKWDVHPAFVDIIKQLTPDEAKLLKAIPANSGSYTPVIDLIVRHPKTEGFSVIYYHYSDVANKVCDCPHNICSYLENLDRLKLIEIDMETFIMNEELYNGLKSSPVIQELTQRPLPDGDTYDFRKGCFRLTSFGLSFVSLCIWGE